MYGERAPDSLEELFLNDDVPDLVEEQIMGLTRICMLEFTSRKIPYSKRETIFDAYPDVDITLE
jgi:hypothetical protein